MDTNDRFQFVICLFVSTLASAAFLSALLLVFYFDFYPDIDNHPQNQILSWMKELNTNVNMKIRSSLDTSTFTYAVELKDEDGNRDTALEKEVGVGEEELEDIIIAQQQHLPPQGFQISAHVVTDEQNGWLLSHVDSSSSEASLPLIEYSDCGEFGSMTDALPISSIQFRQFPPQAEVDWSVLASSNKRNSRTNSGTSSSSSIGDDFNDAQLLVCLSPMEITASGTDAFNKSNTQPNATAFLENKIFGAGEVILLDDIHGTGHKLKSTSPVLPLNILAIHLPHNLNHDHKDKHRRSHHSALFGIHTSKSAQQRNACPIVYKDEGDLPMSKSMKLGNILNKFLLNVASTFRLARFQRLFSSRKACASFGVGAIVSSVAASWLLIVYPPILIRLAELAFMSGMTIGMIVFGDKVLETYMKWRDEQMFSSLLAVDNEYIGETKE